MAEKKSYNDSPTFVPARLESSVHGMNPVADAKDIYDINAGAWQKDINEQSVGYRKEIDEIVAAQTPLTLNVSPTLIEAGVMTAINLSAVANLDNPNEKCSSIQVLRGNNPVLEDSDVREVSGVDNFQPTTNGTTKYKAVFNIRGNEKTKEVNVIAHFPIYYGAASGKTLPDKANLTKTLKTSPAGSYSITVPSGGGFIFFMIPTYMNINTVKSAGFDVPIMAVECSVEGYKAYRNTNDQDAPMNAGTYTFVVS